MRAFILAAFGLQIIFGTSCLLQPASAQELPPAILMTMAPPSAAQHAGCAQTQQGELERRQEGDGPIGTPGCLGHCLSQATNRAIGAAPVTIPGPPAIVSSFASLPTTLAEGTSYAPIFSRALSPPQTATIVLRQ